LGGRVAQLSRTFPDLDPATPGLILKASEVERHPRITLLCNSELEDVKGYVGNFDLKILKKATFVDGEKCDGCGICVERCPVAYPSQYDCGLKTRKAIDTYSPVGFQAGP